MTLFESMDTLQRELAALRETIEKLARGERDLYSAEEVARRFLISILTVRALIDRGKLRNLRIRNLVRVPRSSIKRFCLSNHYEVWRAKDPEPGRTRRPARAHPAGRGAKIGVLPARHPSAVSRPVTVRVFRGDGPRDGEPSTYTETAASAAGMGKGARPLEDQASTTTVPAGGASGQAMGDQHE